MMLAASGSIYRCRLRGRQRTEKARSLARFAVAPIPVRTASEWVITLFRSDFTTHWASADFMRVDPLAGAASWYALARNAKFAFAAEQQNWRFERI